MRLKPQESSRRLQQQCSMGMGQGRIRKGSGTGNETDAQRDLMKEDNPALVLV